MVIDPTRKDRVIHVERTLADALDMYDTRTSGEGLAHYVSEQLDLPKAYYMIESEPAAIGFLTELALTLTPPEDKRMSFRERSVNAAKAATPWEYTSAWRTLMELGYGGLHVELPPGPTVREVGEAIRDVLHEKARTLALQLLNRWKRDGKAFSIDRQPVDPV